MVSALLLRLALTLTFLTTAVVAGAALIWPDALPAVLFAAVAIAFGAVLLSRNLIKELAQVEQALRRGTGAAELTGLQRTSELESQQLGRVLAWQLQLLNERVQDVRLRGEQLGVILEGMVEGVIAVDEHDSVLLINSAARRILGLTGELHGRRLWEVTRHVPVIEVTRAALQGQGEAKGELVIRDGISELNLDLIASPLRGTSGQVNGAVLVLHDLTQVRRLEQVRRDFVANVGHELKTPLTAIHALVETVRDDGNMDVETRRDFLTRSLAQSQRLQALIADLLLLSRVESQEDPAQFEKVDLRRVVRDSLSSLQPMAEAKRISIVIEGGAPPVQVNGNFELLRQAIGNLIDNAIKYTPAGGRVQVTVEQAAESVSVSVVDNGPGISTGHLSRIFERFYRVDKARSREVGGTGLGLAIVKHIALLHQGSVQVESRPGHGSRFMLELPLFDDQGS